jgi:hypothetical protein
MREKIIFNYLKKVIDKSRDSVYVFLKSFWRRCARMSFVRGSGGLWRFLDRRFPEASRRGLEGLVRAPSLGFGLDFLLFSINLFHRQELADA